MAAGDLVKPNWLRFSPDEQRLGVSNIEYSNDPDESGYIRVFGVVVGQKLRSAEALADMSPGFADGIRTHCD